MAKNRSVCYACGYTGLPEGARFCPSCGINLSMESEDINTMDTPMAAAVPISEAFPATEDAIRGDVIVDATHVSDVSPMPIPSTIDTNPAPPQANPNYARYYKNPSKEMLKSTARRLDFGVMFVSTPCRSGKITVPEIIDVFSVMTGTKIDLSVADFMYPTTTVRIVPSVMSGLKIVIPQGVRVEVQGLAIMGGMKGPKNQDIDVSQDAPLLLVQGLTVMGGVKVSVNKRVPPIQIIY
mmetsp:Transcript_30708/g.73677  ORF Transcript_30708/g.73677 Transcript_30708/m.73677 type:complete len:238 (+) Transcript_30708:195-908(+)|eukprot:CAMPEP_0113620934 /NCGR_PEP_ID=MMETSP0017_2-20120614/10681_1 /TAXON_ID=2856 /ORGANISM="Cylindrotheca closterium" /LENGTH=237 /DNA_ID=CAMNT_0000530635 /DNA_START=79 /DNA_END=792 /DNA_ORIENTATION=- /assembly_acc=CAM_ASM_000147